ncbi:unnamed protein product [Rangifer tarandus platyrhynchus]|uniref:Uncharacterized protein n=1 Tax=Rangifer tarandus platyrhynchus TaxID=3082113 RepID=A0AC59YII1_RANTA
MSDPQIQLGSSWKGHQQSDRQGLLGSTKTKGSRCYSIFGENIKLMETEKTYSILSFNWKEENLLKKKLSFLDSMKKYEANAWLMEQKAFYKRCHSKLRKSELAHARLLGNKDLVKRLTSKNMLSNYTTTFVDESEAAVKSIIQNRREGEKNKVPFRLSLDKDRLYPSIASRATLKADSKDETLHAETQRRARRGRATGPRPCPERRARAFGKMLLLLYKTVTAKAGSNSMNMDLGHTSPCSPSRGDSEARAQRKGNGAAPVSGAPRASLRVRARSSVEGEHAAARLPASNALTVGKKK